MALIFGKTFDECFKTQFLLTISMHKFAPSARKTAEYFNTK